MFMCVPLSISMPSISASDSTGMIRYKSSYDFSAVGSDVLASSASFLNFNLDLPTNPFWQMESGVKTEISPDLTGAQVIVNVYGWLRYMKLQDAFSKVDFSNCTINLNIMAIF